MTRIPQSLSLALILGLAMSLMAPPAVAGPGLVRTEWPSAEDPGPPFYARVDSLPPHAIEDGAWTAIVFYRDPSCVPADFNLLDFFDAPRAFGCSLTVEGASLWHSEPFVGSPKIVGSSGTGAVPVWFVPADVFRDATEDGVLTTGELAGLDGLVVGHANQFNETLHPSPLPPEAGGGGHPNSKLIISAHGRLDDGSRFILHVVSVSNGVRAVRIQFR
jgi:hypothetical protein